MGNDAPAEPIRRVPENHQATDNATDKPSLNSERNSLVSGDRDSSYKIAFAGLFNEDREKADQRLVKLGFPKASDVVNFKGSPEAGRDASDQFKGISDGKATSDYIGTLQRAGFTKAEAETLANKTAERFHDIKDGGESHLRGTPAEQMARLNKAMSDVLDKTGVHDGKLHDGQTDHLSDADRQNVVKDMASRVSDPDRFVVQGEHFSCVLESRQKPFLEAGDPARVAEQTASIVNNGSTEIKELKSGKIRTVHVDSRSFQPDAESSMAFDPSIHGDQGKRGMAGHVWDALAGQTIADLKSERAGLHTSKNGIGDAANVYMAAHADEYGATTKTGEGLFSKDRKGNYQLKEDNPGAALWDIAHLNRALGGVDGAVFAHRNLVGSGKPPKGFPADLTISMFGSMPELRQEVGDFQKATGQSGQITVDAPFLPTGAANGHGLHSMNISLNDDKSFHLDNNWARSYDLPKLTDDQVDKATNPDKWLAEGRPTADTVFRPDSGNPTDTREEADRRRQADAKRKEDEAHEEELKRQEEKRKKDEKAAAEKLEQEEARLVKGMRDLQAMELKEFARIKELQEIEQREKEQNVVSHVQPVVSVT